MTIMKSLEKLALNYGKLMLVEAGLPMLLDKVEEVKFAAELKIRKLVSKAILLTIATFFLLVAITFLFVALFFYFLNTGDHTTAAFYTSGVALAISVITFIISAF